MNDCPIPTTILTSQQRAAAVTAAFYQSHVIHIKDVMRLTGLTRRASLNLLETLSGCGGIPIRDIGGGKWELIERAPLRTPPATRPMFKIHPNTRAMIAFTLARRDKISIGELARMTGLTGAEVRWLLQRLRAGKLPIEELAPDVWGTRKER